VTNESVETSDRSLPGAESPTDGECDVPQIRWSSEYVPNLDDLVIEDGKPVESFFAEKQQRLLTEPLFSSWPGPGEERPFLVAANVGLFFAVKEPALLPDVMLSLDVGLGPNLSLNENRSYFLWLMGKAPDVVIEFVSDRRGGETSHKLRDYARAGVPYYVVFDPADRLQSGVLQGFALREGKYESISPSWLGGIGLGLRLWEGAFEDHSTV
jgi:hypothetical protein